MTSSCLSSLRGCSVFSFDHAVFNTWAELRLALDNLYEMSVKESFPIYVVTITVEDLKLMLEGRTAKTWSVNELSYRGMLIGIGPKRGVCVSPAAALAFAGKTAAERRDL